METSIKKYRRSLRRRLRCRRSTKALLMERFSDYQSRVLEEYPEPTTEQLVQAFGPPEAMARELMEEVPPQEQTKYRRNRIVCRICVGVLAVLLILLVAYGYYQKSIPVEVNDTITIIDESNATKPEVP
ncbi:MAG: hypothetical protein ACI3V3_06780 [Faecousia sp.]